MRKPNKVPWHREEPDNAFIKRDMVKISPYPKDLYPLAQNQSWVTILLQKMGLVEMAYRLSSGNRKKVKNTLCGCYYCLEVFEGNEITKFIDQDETAQCPKCGIDSVLAGVTDKNLLRKLNERWFGDT